MQSSDPLLLDAPFHLRRLTPAHPPDLNPAPCSACRGRGCDLCSQTGLAEHMAAWVPMPAPAH